MIISIDRTQPFDPAKFLGEGWTIAEQDERSLSLSQVDRAKVQLEYMLKSGEGYIRGEERLKRLKGENYIRLDAKVFQTLWEKQKLIPRSWKKQGTVFFDGTVLRDPDGDRCVLCLCWVGQWGWDCRWLENHWDASGPSAVLASV